MNTEMLFSPDFSVPAVDYANQGNAILGIRGAGKTYTAMKAAEGLLDAGVPIIVFDPTGVWKYLQVGGAGHNGYPVVVAGGTGSDILLTPDNAVDIVRASMKDGVSLVINLHSAELSNKSTWIKIVQQVVEMLLLENEPHGLRHIFLEEAAEFIPQRIMPNQTKVYSALERLARIGRNMGLGYTIINQRAEEVNKAILEICDLTLMHKQNGKNSLKSIAEWLQVRQVDKDLVKEILASLPEMQQGKCWEIGATATPLLVQVSRRNTIHPDPKKKSTAIPPTERTIKNVGESVTALKKQLADVPSTEKPTTRSRIPELKPTTPSESQILRERIRQLERDNKALREELDQFRNVIPVFEAFQLQTSAAFQDFNRYLKINGPIPADGRILNITGSLDHKKEIAEAVKRDANFSKLAVADISKVSKSTGEKLGKCANAIFHFLATYRGRSFTKAQVAIFTDYSASSSGFNNALSELRGRGMITTINGRLSWNSAYPVKHIERREYRHDIYIHRLGKCENEIYQVLLANRKHAYRKENLASQTPSNYSPTSSGYNNALSRLKTLELVENVKGLISLHKEILNLVENNQTK